VPLAVELSGEHPRLARAEAQAVVEALGGRVVDELERVTVAGGVDAQRIAERVALAWRVIDVHTRCAVEVDRIVDQADRVRLDVGSFAVRCSRLDSTIPPEIPPEIGRRLGARLDERARVDLDDPDTTVRVLLGKAAVIGLEQAIVDRSAYQDRHVEDRPHHSPITLHPRLARALVNLARPRPGDTVWDPFAGTGGIVLEAALAGTDAIASDIDPEMLGGARRTLDHFGSEARLVEGDVADVAEHLDTVDAIATDPPYGRASSTGDEGLDEVYDRFFRAAARVLEPGSRLACPFPDPAIAEQAPASLALVDRFEWYVHNTLTRHICVFERV
jgi:tRNA (guanine10-N2)-dimethyltransferase